MSYQYLAIIHGGYGPDVWEKELKIDAVDFADAAKQAVARANEYGGWVYELHQS